jgi:hypothetical protein
VLLNRLGELVAACTDGLAFQPVHFAGECVAHQRSHVDDHLSLASVHRAIADERCTPLG